MILSAQWKACYRGEVNEIVTMAEHSEHGLTVEPEHSEEAKADFVGTLVMADLFPLGLAVTTLVILFFM